MSFQLIKQKIVQHIKTNFLIQFNTDSGLLRKIIFRNYDIRPCVVRLERLKQQIRLKSTGNVRSNSNISWFPSSSKVQQNSNAALSSLLAYQKQNDVVTGKSAYI